MSTSLSIILSGRSAESFTILAMDNKLKDITCGAVYFCTSENSLNKRNQYHRQLW